MSGQHNVRATARGNTGKGHKPSPRIETKISDPAELDGRYSTDHAMAMDKLIIYSTDFVKEITVMNMYVKFRLLTYWINLSVMLY